MSLFNWSKKSEFAIVGKDIKWTDIKNELFRVIDFDKTNTIIDEQGRVIATSKFKPYGFLTVEWPVIERLVKLPIVHKDDFLLAASVFDDPKFSEQLDKLELLVTYSPKDNDRNTSFLHVLHYVITKSGTFNEYYKIHKATLLGLGPEHIFGSLIWEGELSVKINMTPIF
ncbi:MAG: hypothetical protein GXC72_01780 [Chitinophagaceae bacterium]|nr:hypothetical protein [Chitinophagaceae bacterium]